MLIFEIEGGRLRDRAAQLRNSMDRSFGQILNVRGYINFLGL